MNHSTAEIDASLASLHDRTASLASTNGADSGAGSSCNLANVPIGQRFIVKNVISNPAVPEWQQQLEDLGFISGEPVSLMAKGALGGDPLVVRIGLSTFALRKAEAACILLEAEHSSSSLKAAA